MRFLTVAVGCVLALFGGVLGYLSSAPIQRTLSADAPTMCYFEQNDPFPDHECIVEGTAGIARLSSFTSSGPVVLVFISKLCEPCWQLVHHWDSEIRQNLPPTIKVVWMVDQAEWPLSDGQMNLLRGAGGTVVTSDRAKQLAIDGIDLTPTLVGLDSHQRMAFVHHGYSPNLRASHIARWLNQQ